MRRSENVVDNSQRVQPKACWDIEKSKAGSSTSQLTNNDIHNIIIRHSSSSKINSINSNSKKDDLLSLIGEMLPSDVSIHNPLYSKCDPTKGSMIGLMNTNSKSQDKKNKNENNDDEMAFFIKILLKFDPFTFWQNETFYKFEQEFVNHSELGSLAVTPVLCEKVQRSYNIIPIKYGVFERLLRCECGGKLENFTFLNRFVKLKSNTTRSENCDLLKDKVLYVNYMVYQFIPNHVTLQDIMDFAHGDSSNHYSKHGARKRGEGSTVPARWMQSLLSLVLGATVIITKLNNKVKFINFDIKADNFIIIIDKKDYFNAIRYHYGNYKMNYIDANDGNDDYIMSMVMKQVKNEFCEKILNSANNHIHDLRMIDWESCALVESLSKAHQINSHILPCISWYLPSLQCYQSYEIQDQKLNMQHVKHYNEQIMTYSLGIMALEMVSGPISSPAVKLCAIEEIYTRRAGSQVLEKCGFWDWLVKMTDKQIENRLGLNQAVKKQKIVLQKMIQNKQVSN